MERIGRDWERGEKRTEKERETARGRGTVTLKKTIMASYSVAREKGERERGGWPGRLNDE